MLIRLLVSIFFSHAGETVSPGYYSVRLKDYDIKVELTVSKRAGMHRYTFLEPKDSHIDEYDSYRIIKDT